jgi:hypothetical protein
MCAPGVHLSRLSALQGRGRSTMGEGWRYYNDGCGPGRYGVYYKHHNCEVGGNMIQMSEYDKAEESPSKGLPGLHYHTRGVMGRNICIYCLKRASTKCTTSQATFPEACFFSPYKFQQLDFPRPRASWPPRIVALVVPISALLILFHCENVMLTWYAAYMMQPSLKK